MNIRWGQPNNLMYLYMGGDEAPVWWADYPNLARDLPPNGMLHRCAQEQYVSGDPGNLRSAELYSEKMSASLCGFTCVSDIPLPSNVHRYYTPGATHGGGTASFNWTSPAAIATPSGQSLPNESNSGGASPTMPCSMPSSSCSCNGTPMPRERLSHAVRRRARAQHRSGCGISRISLTFPVLRIEGIRRGRRSSTTSDPKRITIRRVAYRPSSRQSSDKVLPALWGEGECRRQRRCRLACPRCWARLRWVLTSVGTWPPTGWYGPNASNGPGSVGQVFAGAGNSGGYWPFWDTQANRQSAGDPRLSLEERYGTHAGYVCVVTACCEQGGPAALPSRVRRTSADCAGGRRERAGWLFRNAG